MNPCKVNHKCQRTSVMLTLPAELALWLWPEDFMGKQGGNVSKTAAYFPHDVEWKTPVGHPLPKRMHRSESTLHYGRVAWAESGVIKGLVVQGQPMRR